MLESEVIVVENIDTNNYLQMADASVRYALLSIPFTVNRMNLSSVTDRILNIAKGKLAEALFFYYCRGKQIPIDTRACTTPFWQTDQRDFLFDGYEWDIKNNFIFHDTPLFTAGNYTNLPALIPNRFDGDQWSKRDKTYFKGSKGGRILFTFMRGGSKGLPAEKFLEIRLSSEQLKMVSDTWQYFKGKTTNEQPFSEERYFTGLLDRGPKIFFQLNSQPALVITGWAGAEHWPLFHDTDADHGKDLFKPGWFEVKPNGKLSFLNGTLFTKIKNRTASIDELPSFLSLWPQA